LLETARAAGALLAPFFAAICRLRWCTQVGVGFPGQAGAAGNGTHKGRGRGDELAVVLHVQWHDDIGKSGYRTHASVRHDATTAAAATVPAFAVTWEPA